MEGMRQVTVAVARTAKSQVQLRLLPHLASWAVGAHVSFVLDHFQLGAPASIQPLNVALKEELKPALIGVEC